MSSPTAPHVAIIGAGIIGVTAAFELTQRGYRVSMFDAAAPGEAGPSRGNAGHVAGSDIFPLSGPGIYFRGLKMLINGSGPLKIAGRHFPRLAPWLWQFRQAGLGVPYETATKAITQLCKGSVSLTEKLFERAGIESQFRRVPALYLYEKHKTLEDAMTSWAIKAREGHAFTRLHCEEIAQQEPSLANVYVGGVLSHDWAVVGDPLEVVRGIYEAAVRQGATFYKSEVQGLDIKANGILVITEVDTQPFDQVVIAAGLGSRRLAKSLGEALPLEGEGGYNLTYEQPGIKVNYPIVFVDRGVTSTTLDSGLRIGGWAEFAGPNAPARPEYFERLRVIGKELFPALATDKSTPWMGRRPSLPDSVPVISHSLRDSRILYATGHGHYGLSWAAPTARILLGLIQQTNTSNTAFSIRRFNPGRP